MCRYDAPPCFANTDNFRRRATAAGLGDRIGEHRIFPALPTAVAAFRAETA